MQRVVREAPCLVERRLQLVERILNMVAKVARCQRWKETDQLR